MSVLFRNFVICQVDKKKKGGINNLLAMSCSITDKAATCTCMIYMYAWHVYIDHWMFIENNYFCDCCLNENYGLNIGNEEKYVEKTHLLKTVNYDHEVFVYVIL